MLLKKHSQILYNFPEKINFDYLNDNEEIITDIFWSIKITIQKEETINIIDKYIKPYIDYNLVDNYNINFEKDLIIHIRSGDIFDKNFNVNSYIQPPYSFYKKIIEENKFDNIYILSENYNINPIIPKLLSNYKNIKFLSNDLDVDFKIMLNSCFFVNSNSTLCIIINSLSTNKKNIYLTSWTSGFSNFKYTYYNYNDYYSHKNTTFDEKIKRLLEY
jgi:hypothetical protein